MESHLPLVIRLASPLLQPSQLVWLKCLECLRFDLHQLALEGYGNIGTAGITNHNVNVARDAHAFSDFRRRLFKRDLPWDKED